MSGRANATFPGDSISIGIGRCSSGHAHRLHLLPPSSPAAASADPPVVAVRYPSACVSPPAYVAPTDVPTVPLGLHALVAFSAWFTLNSVCIQLDRGRILSMVKSPGNRDGHAQVDLPDARVARWSTHSLHPRVSLRSERGQPREYHFEVRSSHMFDAGTEKGISISATAQEEREHRPARRQTHYYLGRGTDAVTEAAWGPAPRSASRSCGSYVDPREVEAGEAILDRIAGMLHGLGARR